MNVSDRVFVWHVTQSEWRSCCFDQQVLHLYTNVIKNKFIPASTVQNIICIVILTIAFTVYSLLHCSNYHECRRPKSCNDNAQRYIAAIKNGIFHSHATVTLHHLIKVVSRDMQGVIVNVSVIYNNHEPDGVADNQHFCVFH